MAAKAKLILRRRHEFEDSSFAELVIWQLPQKTKDRPHGLKYRLYYGDADGQCLVRYDNETGKGDHKHLGEDEVDYQFVDIDTLLKDFQHDIYRCQKKGGK